MGRGILLGTVPLPVNAESVAYEMLQAVQNLEEPKRTFVLAHANGAPIGMAAKQAGISRLDAMDFLDDADVVTALRMCRDPASRAIGVGMQYQLTKAKEIIEYGMEQAPTFDKFGNPIGERMKDAFNGVKALELLAKITGTIGKEKEIDSGSMSEKKKIEAFTRVRDALRARLQAGESIEATFSRPVDITDAPEGLFE